MAFMGLTPKQSHPHWQDYMMTSFPQGLWEQAFTTETKPLVVVLACADKCVGTTSLNS
jgi:hypothetical protein